MLWLARAWKEQYKGGGGVGGSDFSSRAEQQQAELGITRAKTRAAKEGPRVLMNLMIDF